MIFFNFFFFYILANVLKSQTNIALKILYEDNILSHGTFTSINSLCEISHHNFILLGNDHIIKLYSLDDNFNFLNQTTLSPYTNNITSVRCNGNNEAFLLSPDSYILSKIIISFDNVNNPTLSRYDYVFSQNTKPICFHFNEFTTSTDKLFIITSNFAFSIIEFSGNTGTEFSVNKALSTSVSTTILKCDLNRFNNDYTTYVLSYSISNNLLYENYAIVSFSDGFQINHVTSMKFSSLSTIPSKENFCVLNLNNLNLESYDNTNTKIDSYKFQLDVTVPLIAQWTFVSDTYIFLVQNKLPLLIKKTDNVYDKKKAEVM